jgi:uncharacterized repeat protein (TIGR01451 family)
MRAPHSLALVLALAFTAACADEPPDEPPRLGTSTAELDTQFGAGSLIIPMDTGFQNSGMLRAYGLVYRLLQNNVPVHWVALTGKADQGVDFTVTAPAAVTNRETGAAVALPASYRGGPFIIAAADRAAALPIVTAWLASDTVTVVHDVTAGMITADVQRTLTAAPNIAVFLDGNEDIAFTNLNAAGIPDSAGLPWGPASIDLLSEAQIAGANSGGAIDGLLTQNGAPKYCHLTSMHYNTTALTNEVVREVRAWLQSGATHGFMECEAAVSFESNVNGRYITTNGITDDGATLTTPVNRSPDDLLNQYAGTLTPDGGSVDSIGLAANSAFRANTRTLINQGATLTARILWMTGFLDGDPAKGKLTYLAGHNYSVATPVSNNGQTNGVRLFLNSLFETPCATEAFEPEMTLSKAAPATTAGNTITFTLTYQNIGTGPSINTVITDAIPTGTTFASATNGGTFAAGVVTWNLGSIAPGAMGQVQFTVNVANDGTYQNTATIRYRAGTSPRSATSNTTSTVRDADVPVANADMFTVAEDSSTALNVRANDTGLGDVPIMTVATDPPHGTVMVNANGTIQYTPDPDYFGPDSFTYTITDSTGQSSMAMVTINVTSVNDVPVAVNDAFTVAEDSGATVFPVLANDTGLGDAPVVIIAASDPAGGTVNINANGTVSYTPDPNFSGVDTFTYTIRDADGQQSTATVTVTVTGSNDVPMAADDTFTVAEDSGPTRLDIRANDVGVVDQPVVTAATDPPHGTVAVNADGSVTYTPDPDYHGPDSFSYTVTDADGQMSMAMVSITVTSVDDVPLAVADAITVAEDAAGVVVAVLANDTGLGDPPVAVSAVTQPAHGTVVINGNGTVTYTPAPDYFGPDSFTYTITDGDGQMSTATVTVTVTPVDDLPDAIDDDVNVPTGAPTTIDVLANDTGLGDRPIVVVATDPPHGTVVVNANGTITYTPDLGYQGPDTFTYTITDADGDSDQATVDLTVLIDRDRDGISDAEELTLGTDPDDADSDDDGVLDGAEPSYAGDTDGDGLINALDPDSDNDGLLDGTELGVTQPHPDTDVGAGHFIADDDPATRTDPLDPDTDDGGVPDGAEDTDRDGRRDPGERDPLDPADDVVVPVDSDGDGLPDAVEDLIGTDPQDADSDDDGIVDGAEPNYTDDTDGDGLINPLDPDSDDDGILDGTEVGITQPNADTDVGAGNFVPDADPLTHTSAVDPDTDHGGVPDGAEDVDQDGQLDVGERDPLDPADDTTPLPDADGDGIPDVVEVAIGTDPQDADSDDDGVRDGDEHNYTTDTDGDGLINPLDPDSDNDGLYDGTEDGVTEPDADTDVGAGHFVPDADPSTTTGPLDPDTDDGGVPDGAEDTDLDGEVDPGERDPLNPADDTTPPVDSDGDGLPDAQEVHLGSDPQDADSDDDGVLDGAEPNYGDDTDGDGLINPLDPDSDDDGIFDGTELGVTSPHPDTDTGAGHFIADADPATHTSAVDPDTDDGGVRDGNEDVDHDGQVDAGERDPLDPVDDANPLPDRDGDGLTDAEEAVLHTDPDDADSDDDGVLDGYEHNYTDDTDGDGLVNPLDPDSDNDGLYDGTEDGITEPDADTDLAADNFVPDADPSTTTGPLDPDTDDGGVTDGAEDFDHDGEVDAGEGDPNHRPDDGGLRDDDNDGLTDGEELALGTDPQDADSDDDGVIDGDEANPSDDTDGDGTINPRDPDSDGDGILDGTEVGVTEPNLDTDVGAGNFVPDADPSTTTSMVNPDTDFGGIPDGEEDMDHDGRVDDGERDPLDPADDEPLDTDGDGIADPMDNCPTVANPGQENSDDDADGDACDLDDDNDGFQDDYGVSGGGCAAGGSGAGALPMGLALFGLAALIGRRRRARAAARISVAAAGLAALAVAAPTADAQEIVADRGDFSVERFGLSTAHDGILGVEGAGLGRRWEWDLHLWLGTADDPLVVYMDGADRTRVGSLVQQRTGGELGFSIVLHERFGLGLDAPLIFSQQREAMIEGVVGTLPAVDGVGLGDLRLTPKLRLLVQARHKVDLAIVPELVLPTSSGDDYHGDSGVGFAPYLALSERIGRLRWAIDLGYAVRSRATVGGLVVDDELRARGGLAVAVTPAVELAATMSAATPASAPFEQFSRNHLELVGGPVIDLADRWQLFAAGGAGLREGYGTPDWRALIGLRVGRGDAPRDLDGDGLIATDQCPRVPEDFDSFEDADGCADPDNDQDLVLDVDDGAPLDPEDRDGFEDQDGVPDPDNDRDGVLDASDSCPLDPETANGFQDDDGCPDDPDTDGDGVADRLDQCPTDPEDRDGVKDEDGCPEDNDADGLLDAVDNCPDLAGPPENRGCPDRDRDGDTVVDRLDNCPDEPGTVPNRGCKEKQLAVLDNGRIEILDIVYFKTNKAVIQPRSFPLLDSVANIIKNHPELPTITIEGHTDDRGNDAYNLDLSQRRAESVRRYLIAKGIDGGRLVAKGYGESRPIKPNDSNANRSANRRVEFKIEGVGSANTGPTTDTMDP